MDVKGGDNGLVRQALQAGEKCRETKLIDVASETGFSDIRDFRRAFKRWTGVTPREARHEMQQFRKDIQRP